jgi:hypothetical protein
MRKIKVVPLDLNKRKKIIASAVILTIGLLLIHTVNIFFLGFRFLIVLSVVAFLLSLWSLWEGMTKEKAAVLLILPTLFTLAVGSFYFLLPLRWLTRLPVAVIFGLSFYALLLSQNVFNVSSSRTIPLYRAASTVAFLFTLITAFFTYNVIYALELPFMLNGLLVTAISFPLILQILWSIELEKVTTPITVYSLILSLIIGQSAIALSFWPVAPTIWSLTLASQMYVLLGIITEFFKDRLNRRVVVEYLGVGGVVLLFTVLRTSWGS